MDSWQGWMKPGVVKETRAVVIGLLVKAED
jgi:hypothetical protein